MHNERLYETMPAGWRGVAAVEHARRLRSSATALRRLAGGVKYHPVTGQRPQASADLLAALDGLEQVLAMVQKGAEARALDEAEVAASGHPDADLIRAGHATIEQASQAAAAAAVVLRGLLLSPDGASLDAPYGHGAPARQHPGALCTIIASRVERLAGALETVAVVRANAVP